MRYEDASSSFDTAAQGATDARNDADALAAGSRGPATGNTITGAGTITGVAGADTVANGPGQIVSLEGASGSDTSDGGSLNVQGRFGELTMDSRGGYSYKPNGEAPEGGRDVFRYTLEDAEGARDTATLTIDIGREPDKVDANAQQIVPGPDGVVTLPPGVQLSDVQVVGRNLVINMPDGSQMVIIDGAVFVPQLVLGGVEVPASNLAALLIDLEPKPAAGVPLSSGGNFAVDIPPLDPGVPLGDLIPPTELAFTPPEFQDVGQFEEDDEEPTITIEPDGQPASVAAVDSVDEAGLPTRNGGEPAGSGESADGNSSDDDDGSEATSGVINISSPDGIGSLVMIDGDGNPVDITSGGLVHGDYGDLVVTLSGGVYSYSYTLRDNTSGDVTHDDFAVILTDEDGDTATATLTINIVDDTPTARPDTDSIAAGQFGPALGNVITDARDPGDVGDSDTNAADTVGADDARVTSIDNTANATAAQTVPADGSVVVAGQYGSLTIFSNGNYSYTRNAETPGGVTETFSYTITDGDGDPSTSTLTIDIGNLTVTVGENPIVRTDDDAVPLAGGNPGTPEVGDDVDAANLTGTLSGSGGDGTLTFDLQTSGAPAGFTYVDGPAGSVLVQQVQDGVTVTVLTITVAPTTGAYTVTQNAPIEHPADDGGPEDNLENNLSFTINYTVTDIDADTASGSLTINVDDDTPIVVTQTQLSGVVDEDGLSGGNDGGSDDVAGENVIASGNVSGLFSAGADQPLTYSLLTNTTGLPTLSSNGIPLVYSVSGNTLTAKAGADGPTVFTFTVDADSGEYVFTLRDQLDHPSLDGEAGDDTENPTGTDIAIQLGSIIQATDSDGDSVTASARGLIITVDDDSPDSFGDVCPDEVEIVNGAGAVSTGSLNLPSVGADQPGTVSFVVEDGDAVVDGEGEQLSYNGQLLFYTVSPDDPTILQARTSATPGEGTLVFQIDVNGGNYTYTQFQDITSVTKLNISTFEGAGGGNVDGLAVDVENSPFDLILSTKDGDTVNTNDDLIGISGGQSFQDGEVLRVDFVQNAFVTGSGGGAVINYGEYYAVNGYRQDVVVLGSGNTANFTVKAIVAVEAVPSAGADADGDAEFYNDGNDTTVASTQLNIYTDTGDTPLTAAELAAAGIIVTNLGGGVWQVIGLPDGYDYEITSATAFNAVQIEAIDNPATTGVETFKLGEIEMTTTVQTAVDFSIPIALTDADGDSVYCDIHVNLGPPTSTPNVSILVDEAALTVGTDPTSPDETQGGDLSDMVTGGNGPYTFALAGGADGSSPYGTLTLLADGTYSFTLTAPVDSQPDANDGSNVEGGVVVYTYEATDADGNVTTGTITVNVVDDAPIANDDTLGGTQPENAPVLINVFANDLPGADGVDIDNNPAVKVSVVGGTLTGTGSLVYNNNGTFTYTPGSGESGQVSFQYQIVDNDGDADTATVTFTIAPDSVPTLSVTDLVVDEQGLPAGTGEMADGNAGNNSDSSETSTAGSMTITTGGDTLALVEVQDKDGNWVNVTGATVGSPVLVQGTHGTLSVTSSGGVYSYTYTLTQNYTTHTDTVVGTDGDSNEGVADQIAGDNFAVRVTDSDSDTTTVTASTTINVTVNDDAPIATNDSVSQTGGENSQVVISPFGNDLFGADGVNLTTGIGFTQPPAGQGTVTYSTVTNQFTFTPASGQSGSTSFTYTLTDGDGDTSTATVTITLGPDSVPTLSVTDLVVDEQGLPAGTGEMADGNAGNNSDSSETSTAGSMTITTGGDTLALVEVQDKDGNWVNVTGATVGSPVLVQGTHGTLSVTSSGGVYSYTYTLTQNYTTHTDTVVGTDGDSNEGVADQIAGDNFAVRVTDSDSDTTTVTASTTINVTVNDDAPIANNDSVSQTGGENSQVVISPFGNDLFGADGVNLTTGIGFTQPPAGQGTVTYSTVTNQFTFTPASGQSGSTSFTYTLTDGDGDTSTATVTITLAPDSTSTVSVTDLTVDEQGLPLGTGEQGPAAEFALGVAVRASNNSDTSETSSAGSMTITTGGDTLAKVEIQASNGTWVDVTAATVGSPIQVQGTHGVLSVTSSGGVYSYTYTLTQNYNTHPDTITTDSDGIEGTADPLNGDSFAVRVTDSDNDVTSSTPAASAIIEVTVLDDAPVIYTAPAPLTITNSGTVSGTANFDFAIGADQRTSYSASNSDFSAITLTGTVGTNAITSPSVTWVSETSTQAVYNIAFSYVASGGTVAATGTLTLDKATGSYTVDLAAPIQANTFSSIANASPAVGYADNSSTPMSSNPDVSVIQLNNGMYVQFSGYAETGSGTGNLNIKTSTDNDLDIPGDDENFANGEILVQARDYVTISGLGGNGVHGDTMNKGEVLDFDIFNSATNPTGFTSLTPNGSVESLFVMLDGVGNNEDLIMVLKLYDTTTGTFTTKAVYVDNADFFKQGDTDAGKYSGVVASLDGNDALIVIEPDDYNTAAEPGRYVIVGAQLMTTDEGIIGSAIDLNGAVDLYDSNNVLTQDGATTAAATTFSADTDDTGFKIKDIGFVTTTTQTQAASLNFALHLVDSEGDTSPTQNLAVTVTPVVLDTDNDGAVEYLSRDDGVRYDYNGDGVTEATGWAAAGDSILVRDADGNGTVTDASEFVFGGNGLTDLQALAAQYGGQLDADDADFASFKVWNDANSNGVAEAGELQSLSDAGITSISLVSDGVASVEAGGDVLVAGSGTYTYVNDNGEAVTGTLGDAAFVVGSADSDDQQLQKAGANNNSVLLGAIAAAGLGASSMVAAEDYAPADRATVSFNAVADSANTAVADEAVDGGGVSRSALDGETREALDEPVTDGSSADRSAEALGGSLTDTECLVADTPTTLLQGTEMEASELAQSTLTSASVGMPSAEMLEAAQAGQGLEGGAKTTGEVARVLAEALDGGGDGPSIDAVIDAVANHSGGKAAALEALATPGDADVSGWHTSGIAGFTDAHAAFSAEAMAMHPDAVQTAA